MNILKKALVFIFLVLVSLGIVNAMIYVQGDAYQFTKIANRLNLNENLTQIKSTLTDSDFNALADGTFKGKTTERYVQTLKSPSGAMVVLEEYSKFSGESDYYLKFPANQKLIEYKLNFGTGPTSGVDSNNRLKDFENQKIFLLGKEYTVIKAENTTNNNIILTLMGGVVQDTLSVGETKTYTLNGNDYEVTVMIASGDISSTAITKFIVNDSVTPSLATGETYLLPDGVELGIKNILPTKSGDVVQNIVEFYLGVEKFVLDGNDHSMDIGSNTNIEDVYVEISTYAWESDLKINSIEIIWAPSRDLYVPVDGKLDETCEAEGEADCVEFLEKFEINYVFSGLKEVNSDEFLVFITAGETTIIRIDSDDDGVADAVDNCIEVYNPSQLDSNDDNIGDACEDPWCMGTDMNHDLSVDLDDFVILKKNFLVEDCSSNGWCNNADSNKDDVVDRYDFIALKDNFGRKNCLAG